VLTRDATSLGDRLVVLALCVVDRGCALPVAWTILPAGQKRAWRCAWFRMLRLLRPAVPASWTVLVLADCGVDACWRFRRMARLGWHPFLRINQGGTFRLAGQARCVWWSTLVGAAGRRWRGRGTAFASSDCRLDGTLAAWWSDGHAEPWLVLTDRDPDGCDAPWDALRSWCDQRGKGAKRGGWQWQQTQMTNPARASRL
jgi:hypothetical protein